MKLTFRLRRAVKELLGMPQWPRVGPITPNDFEEQIYAALLRQGDVCFDVGANGGAVALLLARLAGPSGCVYSFEPVPQSYRQLCHAAQRDDYRKAPIITLPFGLSDMPGRYPISIPNGEGALASLGRPAAWDGLNLTQVETCLCDFTTLDTLRADYPKPDFIKIDVEGAELLVLKGSETMFIDVRPLLLIEVFAPWERAFNYTPWDVFAFLLQFGYQFLFACPGGLIAHKPSAEQPFPPEFEAGYNVVAYDRAHGTRIARLRALRQILPMQPPPIPNQ
jgi:FkbM family methyltransferase